MADVERWYAAASHPHAERRAQAGLSHRGFQAYLPYETRWSRRAGARRAERLPLFVGYVFVRLAETPDGRPRRLHDLRAVEGVHRLVGVAGEPRALPDDFIAGLVDLDASGAFDRTRARTTRFAKGDAVRVIAGPFSGCVAEIVQADDTRRVQILLQMLGGGRMSVDAHKLEKIEAKRPAL